jgi:asparagine synthetase B (glutamine-hydrolysing)
VRQLPPGFQLVWNQEDRSTHLKSYLSATSSKLKQKKFLTEETVSELDSIFQTVVSKQLIADTKVGAAPKAQLKSWLEAAL